MDKHLIWATALVVITLAICGTLIYLNENAWTMRFEMDDNTKEAVKSIDWRYIGTDINKVELYYDIDDNETIFVKENDTYVEVELNGN